MCRGRQGEFLSPARLGHCTDKSLPPFLACALPPCASCSLPSFVFSNSACLSCLSLSSHFLCLAPSLLSSSVLFLYIISSFVLPAGSVCLHLMYLLVNIYKYIFGVLLRLVFFPLFFLSFLCPCALFACVFRLQIFMPLGIYTPKSLFCHCRLAYPFSNTFSCPFLCRVCLTLSVFLGGTSSLVLQVLSIGQSGSSGM